MNISLPIHIAADRETVWNIITDIPRSIFTISAIEKIEVLEQGDANLLGFKWRETRTMFGKEATEVMWITDIEKPHFYTTRAESHGAVYTSKFELQENDSGTLLTMSFQGTSNSVAAKLMNILMGWMFKKATINGLKQDLEDIKTAAEKAAGGEADNR